MALAALSFALSMVEGFFYYQDLQHYQGLRILMIIQNSIGGFLFNADISIGDVIANLGENPTLIQSLAGYAYAVAVFLAPLCTIAVFYRALELLLGLQAARLFVFKHPEHILIFGYNEYIPKMLEDGQSGEYKQSGKDIQGKKDKQKARRIRVVTCQEVSDYERCRFRGRGVTFHTADCFSYSDRELRQMFREVKLHKIQKIILFEDTAEKNFSLYYLLSNKAERLPEEVKIYCCCEDEGIHRLLEDYYNNKGCQRASEKLDDNKKCQRKLDIETFSINELFVRELLKEKPLHTCYLNSQKSPHDWRVHLLILGFGGLGQQVLIQAMNLGVVSWDNEILIDVVDLDINKKRDNFGSRFDGTYVKMGEKEFAVPEENVDGKLRIRFHQIDVCGREFPDFLNTAGGKDPFTYITICMQDPKVGLHALFETERFMARQKSPQRAVIGIRMDVNDQMAQYLEKDYLQKDYLKVMGYKVNFDLIYNQNNDTMAQKYHKVYRNIQIKLAVPESVEMGRKDTEIKGWKSLSFHKLDSNRALAYHNSVKKSVIERYEKDWKGLLDQYFDSEDSRFHQENDTWFFHGTEQELVDWINHDTFLRDMAMLEHRRWCLFMASKGWGPTEGEKNEVTRENPCMVNWELLCRNKLEMCKYDLIPLLALYEEGKPAENDV